MITTLTPKQLASLRHDLIALATIEHEDVMNELLDHYASLTERKMENGMSFDEASKWSWAEMGSGEGIQKIQTNYEKSIRKQVGDQHLLILKSYFRWPTLLTTVLIGILAYLTLPLLSVEKRGMILFSLLFCPYALLIWGYYRSVDSRISTGKIVWHYMQQKGYLPIHLLQIGINVPNAFFDNGSHTTLKFLQQYPVASVLLCLVCLLYTISFTQLYWHKFYLKIA